MGTAPKKTTTAIVRNEDLLRLLGVIEGASEALRAVIKATGGPQKAVLELKNRKEIADVLGPLPQPSPPRFYQAPICDGYPPVKKPR